MTETKTPAQVADSIAEGVRTLNYLTGAGGTVALEYPGDLYSVIANLKIASNRLPQLFDQMAKWLTGEYAAGRVAHDRGSDPSEYVTAVADALKRAAQDALTLSAALDSAHEASSGLKSTDRPAEDEPHQDTPMCPVCQTEAPHIAWIWSDSPSGPDNWQCTVCGHEWNTPNPSHRS
jgi:hypothetical protein